MIADLKPYAKYKKSGLPWLGSVPAHWEVRQARHIGRFLKGVGGTKEDAVPAGVPCVRYGELYTTYTYFIRASKAFIRAERAAGYMPIQYGDVLFAASGETIEEIGKSAVNLMQTAAVCGGDVIVLRPSIPVHAPFLGYAMDCRPATNQKATMGRGTTVKHIYPDELRSLLFPLPTLDEQAEIVRLLDWANGRLERAIRAKRKVIALLNEQKQVIIHRAVTRGLDPSVPLKASGISWLGDIPQHWEATKLYRVTDPARKIMYGNCLTRARCRHGRLHHQRWQLRRWPSTCGVSVANYDRD
jgi:type I restriction enzyme S subunit